MPVFRKDGRSLLFVHIPKTGGTSVEQWLRASGWEIAYLDGKYGAGTLNNLRWCGPQHMHAEVLASLFRLDRFDLVFAFVRDPVARLRSEYLWRNRKAAEIGVDADSVERWFVKALAGYRGNHYLWDNHLRPQHEFEVPGTEIVRFEDGLRQGLETLDRRHDLGLVGELEHFKNSGAAGGPTSSEVAISPATARRIRRFYGRDFRRYGYSTP